MLTYSLSGFEAGGGQAVQAATYVDANTYEWAQIVFSPTGLNQYYGVNNTYSYGYSFQAEDAYSLTIQPSDAFNNKLTIYPTADYDIHLYESNTHGAITLGSYGQTNFRVYGPGGANNGGGLYANDIRADLVGNSKFNITTNNGNWAFNPDGTITGNLIPASSNTYSLGTEDKQWKNLYVSSNTIFIDKIPLKASNGSLSVDSVSLKVLYDELKRPIYNPNALDINADGGISAAVYSPSDPMFDGGATQTVYGLYEAGLDGGASFNNKHSASYIDGGGANII